MALARGENNGGLRGLSAGIHGNREDGRRENGKRWGWKRKVHGALMYVDERRVTWNIDFC